MGEKDSLAVRVACCEKEEEEEEEEERHCATAATVRAGEGNSAARLGLCGVSWS